MHPVETSYTKQDKDRSNDHRDQGHELCETDDGFAPFYFKQVQQTGNDGTGIAQPDKENEVDNKQAPNHIIPHSGYAVSFGNLQVQGIEAGQYTYTIENGPGPGTTAVGFYILPLVVESFFLICIEFHN